MSMIEPQTRIVQHRDMLGPVRMSAGVEWAVHCCVVISQADEPVSAQKLAEFHGVSRTYLAKSLQALSRAGIVRTTEGRAGGYVLALAAGDITVLDIVQAVDGSDPAFRCTEIRQNGPFGAPAEQCTTPCGVAVVMASAERAWRESLRAVSVADLAGHVAKVTDVARQRAVRDWLSSSAD
ncbi:BadM/Rrf2 family transcriptional regulator [Knoellia remsis]|uniref:BadM/Rrf2 family transcriptional regulator n=2 Tax=Knoellia remsis TaxID=407159 RepID=A0A2T0TUR0_9MICO|nr:BadM/Rrf2 family transcriptional regulator [Knoellia remsis]